jgi:sec-independent protein translocase protein TatA
MEKVLMEIPELLIVLVIVGFLVFGAKRMPDAARGLGRSLRIFKAETKGLLTDDQPVQPPAPVAPLQIPAPAPVYAPPAQQQAPVYAAPVQQAPAPVYAAPVQQAPVAAPAPAEQPVPEHHDAQ